MFKEQKGITLVALVITIIVLLILAGVSISLVVGNNGVLTRASDAVNKNTVANVREKVTMAFASAEMAYQTEWAGNTARTRVDSYTATLANELTSNGLLATGTTTGSAANQTPISGTTATIATEVTTNSGYVSTSGASLYVTFENVVYEFQDVKVDELTGSLSMGNTVNVYTSNKADQTVTF